MSNPAEVYTRPPGTNPKDAYAKWVPHSRFGPTPVEYSAKAHGPRVRLAAYVAHTKLKHEEDEDYPLYLGSTGSSLCSAGKASSPRLPCVRALCGLRRPRA